MKPVFLMAVTLAVTGCASQQQLPSIDDLHFLIGTWEGIGEHRHDNGKVNRFRQTNVTSLEENGEVLVSEQSAALVDNPDRIIYSAVITYYFDASAHAFFQKVERRDGRVLIEQLEVAAYSIAWTNQIFEERFVATVRGNKMTMTATSLGSAEQVFRAEFKRLN